VKSVISVSTWALALSIQFSCGTAHAASSSISGLLQVVAPTITNIAIPKYGTVGDLSLGVLDTLPVISKIKLPLVGKFANVPIVGSLTVSQGVSLLEAVAPLQNSLPGLGALDASPH
jgi:hypothetical protein